MGCDVRESTCKHIEQELSKVYAHRSVRATPISYIDAIKAHLVDDNIRDHALSMLEKLRKYGLEDIYCQVLTCKFVYAWSDADIADALNIPSRKTVFSIRKRGLEILKERGFK